MKNTKNQTDSALTEGRGYSFVSIAKKVAIAIVVIAVAYLFLNPDELKRGKEFAKAGDHNSAILEFIDGINRHHDDDFSGRRTQAIQRLSYKMNLHNFFYNLGVSYEALGDAEEKVDSAVYYAYALEAYNETILTKENNKKAIESKEFLEKKFEELFGESYVYGSIQND